MHLHPVRPESLCTECWALPQHHRWQLRRVARQNQPTPLALVDVFNQIVQQMATPEGVLPRTFVRDHRRLIDDKERVFLQVLSQRKAAEIVRERLLAIDLLMDRKGVTLRIFSEHLRRPSRGCQQHAWPLHGMQSLHHRPQHSRLARTGVSPKNQQRSWGRIRSKSSDRSDRFLLLFGRFIREILRNLLVYVLVDHVR